MKTIRWLRAVAGKRKRNIVLLLLTQTVLGVTGVCYAVILRNLVDAAVGRDRRAFFFAVAVFAGVAALQIAIRAAERFLEEYTRAELENQCRNRLFSDLLYADFARVSATHSGEWMNRLTSDAVVVADGMTQILPGVAGMLVRLAGALVMILALEPRFGYILVPGGALFVLLTYGFRRVLKRLHKGVQEADGAVRVFLQECLGSMLAVKAFARENQTLRLSKDRMEQHKKARMKRNHFSNVCNAGFGVIMNGAYVLGAAWCGYGILMGTMSYGTLMAILQLIGQVQNPFANITGYLPRYYAMLASAERLMEAEAYPADGVETVRPLKEMQELYQSSFAGLSLKDAGFTYQAPVKDSDCAMPVVLSDVNLDIKKGEYAALTGPSGCGKSTVLKLLMCLYPLDAGERSVCVREKDSRGVSQIRSTLLTSSYRRLFAYVPQGSHLMSGTIREIIAFSDSGAGKDEDRIWNALTIACGDGFVKELDKGIDTILGERGTGLSEGQMQRIAIARAVFSDNPILMLDEATSALDEQTERQLLSNLRSMTDKTVLIVTHRPEALSICDKEIRFSKDKVTEHQTGSKDKVAEHQTGGGDVGK